MILVHKKNAGDFSLSKVKEITVKTQKQWRDWLKKNHLTEDKVFLISYKKHTGKKFITHREQMNEAICFGWIDTTIKKIDEDQYGRYLVKRKETANWSKNTLSYGAELLKAKKMSAYGKKMYLLGLKAGPLDADIPDNPIMPKELKLALSKNKKAKETFKAYSPSAQKGFLRWIYRAKREETKAKRILAIFEAAKKGEKPW